MSESGYQTLDLDNPGATPIPDDLEIIQEEEVIEQEPESDEAPVQQTPVANKTDDEDEDEGGGEEGGKRRQTRSQRLKAARDAWQARATEAEERAKAAEAKAAKYESDATEGAAVGLDLYIQTIDDRIKAKRADYNAAFDAGDRDKVWEAQQELV